MRRLIPVCLIAGLLAACDAGTGLVGGGAPGEVTRALSVAEGRVVVAGPAGFCIDQAASSRRGEAAVVVMASCAVLSAGQEYGPPRPTVLTATVDLATSPEGSTSGATLSSALASYGPSDVRQVGDLTLLRLERGGNEVIPDGIPIHWRGGLVVNGHTVLLGAFGPENSGVDRSRGEDLVRRMARAIKAASPDADSLTPSQNGTRAAPLAATVGPVRP